MSICKYCGNEAGDGEFCRSCGAMNEGQAVTPQRMTADDYRQLENADQVGPDAGSNTTQQPENKYFRPQAATGLLAANIVVLVLGVLGFCNSLGVTLLAIIFSIIGIMSASRVKSCTNDADVNRNRSVATMMLVLGIIALVVGYIVLIVLKIIGSLAHGLFSLFT